MRKNEGPSLPLRWRKTSGPPRSGGWLPTLPRTCPRRRRRKRPTHRAGHLEEQHEERGAERRSIDSKGSWIAAAADRQQWRTKAVATAYVSLFCSARHIMFWSGATYIVAIAHDHERTPPCMVYVSGEIHGRTQVSFPFTFPVPGVLFSKLARFLDPVGSFAVPLIPFPFLSFYDTESDASSVLSKVYSLPALPLLAGDNKRAIDSVNTTTGAM